MVSLSSSCPDFFFFSSVMNYPIMHAETNPFPSKLLLVSVLSEQETMVLQLSVPETFVNQPPVFSLFFFFISVFSFLLISFWGTSDFHGLWLWVGESCTAGMETLGLWGTSSCHLLVPSGPE